MIKTLYICWALMTMPGVVNQHNICNNITQIEKVTTQFKIDPILYVSILWEESNFTPDIESRSNACGISQVIPKYTTLYNKKKSGSKERKRVCNELKKVNNGLFFGAKSFSYWFHTYSKKKPLTALCAYNAGFRCKNEKLSEKDLKARKRAMSYAKKVIKFSKRLRKRVSKIRKKEEFIVECIKDYFDVII